MKTRIQSLAAVLLAALILLGTCPISAFAANPATTGSVATATAYCYKYPSCQGKHAANCCPGPQRLTQTRSQTTVGGVQYTVAATKPTTSSATTVTISAPSKATYSYTVSADNKTITEHRNGVVTRTANVADYVDANAPARTTKFKKDGKFSYQKVGSNETQMQIWKDNGTKATITRTRANADAYFAYQAAIDNNIKAFNTLVVSGVALGVAAVAIVAATFATAGLVGAAAATVGAKVGVAVLGVSTLAGGTAGGILYSAKQDAQTAYQDAKKYYYILKG